jgi:hypothetical protein
MRKYGFQITEIPVRHTVEDEDDFTGDAGLLHRSQDGA